MTSWVGPHLAACVLLVVAGVAKVREPASTQQVLRRLARSRVPVPNWAVRGGGLAELVLGAVALVTSSATPAALVAFCYLAFAGLVAVSIASGSADQGCGCFGGGGSDVPLGPLHIVVNLGLATAALAVAAGGGLPAPGVERVAASLLGGLLAWVVYQVLVPLPRLMAAVRSTRR